MKRPAARFRREAALIAAACVVEVLGMSAFATFPTLLADFRHEWGINNTEAGWVSGVYFAGYVAAVALLTTLTDRIDARRIYLTSIAISGVGALGFATASGLWSASLWRVVQGIGLAGTYMPGLRALTDALPLRMQSRATAFYTASFGVGASLSYYLAGLLAPVLGWRATFAWCALGPLVGFVAALFVVRASAPAGARTTTHLLDFRPVLANRRAFGFMLAYLLHSVELFAFRSWVVTFLVFSQHQQPSGARGLGWSAATIAALVNLIGLPSSVLTNEIATRHGRQLTIITVLLLSAAAGIVFGFSATSPFWIVVVLAFVYGTTITADSATITAGVVAVADPRYKGATMAMHSVLGFAGAFAGPVLFGAVLDAAGGAASPHAWGLGFAAMSALLLAGPPLIVRLIGIREPIR